MIGILNNCYLIDLVGIEPLGYQNHCSGELWFGNDSRIQKSKKWLLDKVRCILMSGIVAKNPVIQNASCGDVNFEQR